LSVAEAAVTSGPSEAEEERRTSYLELFFDLVFVFAITQVTVLLLSNTSAAGFARSALVLALVWWAWSGFTWMTNAIDIESQVTKLLFLAGMAGAFFMALAVPHAYTDQGVWFGCAYLFIGVLNISLYGWGLKDRPAELAALKRLVPFFLLSPALVLVGGLVDKLPLRSGLWVAAIVVAVGGVLATGNDNAWRVSPAHFAERYALIVIIALGESIVAIGTSVEEIPRDAAFALSVLVAFAGSRRCGSPTSASSRGLSSERCSERSRTSARRSRATSSRSSTTRSSSGSSSSPWRPRRWSPIRRTLSHVRAGPRSGSEWRCSSQDSCSLVTASFAPSAGSVPLEPLQRWWPSSCSGRSPA